MFTETFTADLHGVVPTQRCSDGGARETAGTPVAAWICTGELSDLRDDAGDLAGLTLRIDLRSDPARVDAVNGTLRSPDGCSVHLDVDRLATGWRVAADQLQFSSCGGTQVSTAFVAGDPAAFEVPGATVTEDTTGFTIRLPSTTGNAALAGLVAPGRVIERSDVEVGQGGTFGSQARLPAFVVPTD